MISSDDHLKICGAIYRSCKCDDLAVYRQKLIKWLLKFQKLLPSVFFCAAKVVRF